MEPVFSAAPRWVVASHNTGKIKEIGDLLAPHDLAVIGAAEAGLEEPEETESSFAGNALLKARAAAAASGEVALADDSGLCVTALGGAPGVRSARWAGEPRDFARAMARVEDALAQSGDKDRSAQFICVLALAHPGGQSMVFEGKAEGQIVWPPRGSGGFGYDPIFVPRGHDQTFAEMDAAQKRALSHRADAFAKLMAAVFG